MVVLTSRARKLASGVIIAVALCVFIPENAQAFAKAIWGEVQHHGVNQFPLYRRLGVSIYQTDLNWYQIATRRPLDPRNPNDPAYSWPADVTQAIAQAKRFHMRVLLLIIGTPSWANGGRAWNWAPSHPSDLAAFAAAATRKYPDVRLWMIWGEPTNPRDFQPLVPARPFKRLNAAQRVAPHLYARLLDASYGALKSVSRRNLVIGGNTPSIGEIDARQWIENLRLPNGRRPRMDMYGHNPFGSRDPNFSNPPACCGNVDFSDLPRLARLIDRNLRRGMPLFLSEWTIPTGPHDEEFNFWVDPPVAARWIRDALRLARHWHRIYALGWIHVYDVPPISAGGLLTVNGHPKPSFFAFEHG